MQSGLSSVHRSGLIVELASVDPVVAQFRAALDPMEPFGVPPHITVLFPFVTGDITAVVTTKLTALFSEVHAFSTRFSGTQWFGEQVLWLAPDDPQPYIELTRAAISAFPEYPPYGDQFDEITPHLTVADGANVEAMRDAARNLGGRLPMTARADGVTLMTQAQPGGAWSRAVHFPFKDQ
jgi:2'-5' RNA ligase